MAMKYFVALREFSRKPFITRVGRNRYLLSAQDFTEVSAEDYKLALRAQDRFFLKTAGEEEIQEVEKQPEAQPEQKLSAEESDSMPLPAATDVKEEIKQDDDLSGIEDELMASEGIIAPAVEEKPPEPAEDKPTKSNTLKVIKHALKKKHK